MTQERLECPSCLEIILIEELSGTVVSERFHQAADSDLGVLGGLLGLAGDTGGFGKLQPSLGSWSST